MTGPDQQGAPQYKSASRGTRHGRSIRPARILAALAVTFIVLTTLAVREGERVAALRVQAGVPTPRPAARLPAEVPPRQVALDVRRGDSLARLFALHGLSAADLHDLMRLPEARERLHRVLPGDRVLVRAEVGGRVRSLEVALDEVRTLHVERAGTTFVPRIEEHPFTVRLSATEGEIESSLFAAGAAAGMSTALTAALAGVFGYDIDFLQDLRVGDRFRVVHEELWRDGAKVRDGAILVAEFVNAGRVLRAVRFETEPGRSEYYAPDGSSMRKALMRNPIDFARISSNFNPRRRHPILNKVRAHQGVDYAAPQGTPVRVTGDGKVTFRGVKGGYGNTVIVQHGATFSTLYAHLSRFAPGLSVGSRVHQEQVIGHVGRTGLATASHLHYEVRVGGVHRNPRTVRLPDATPVPAEMREAFVRHSAEVLGLLPAPPLRAATLASRT